MESFALHSPSSTTFVSHSSRLSFHLRHCPLLPKSPPSISLRPLFVLRPAVPSSLSSTSFSLLTPKTPSSTLPSQNPPYPRNQFDPQPSKTPRPPSNRSPKAPKSSPSEALIAPAMPSTTARAGGVFLPIIKSLSLAAGSKPGEPSAKKLGAYLVQSQFQSAGNSSALFLTAAAQNLLCLRLAEELGVVVANPWVSWFVAAKIKDTPDAPAMATRKLEQMGPVTRNEWAMVGTMLLAVSLWVFGDALGIASVVAAMLGLSILLLWGVLDWEDCLTEKSAWDTLAWFAVLVGMAAGLLLLPSFRLLTSSSITCLPSQTGHVGALFSAFLAMHLASGVPCVLAALALAYNTNLFGAITHYSSGQAAVYYGAGYVDLPDVFRMGFVMAVINAIIWGVVGMCWWKFLGLY
ncbi:dicarboxylate transport 2.1 [Actinidia rufa]|uniref:Dicarboxylate transport 2.1 n=1 Tax=Actinidia rufa TaxID=165716 RepID=A0A7J0FAN7_9ERIC|nr:dicarboxylate transport 2.1 [Actinidia rufa]